MNWKVGLAIVVLAPLFTGAGTMLYRGGELSAFTDQAACAMLRSASKTAVIAPSARARLLEDVIASPSVDETSRNAAARIKRGC